jgi:glycosyltransferase involved in cell wall biosynthesis
VDYPRHEGRAEPTRLGTHVQPATRRTDPAISVVLPVLNEAAVLPALYRRLCDATAVWPGPSELIFVDDGSTDATLHMLRRLAQEDPRIKVVSFARNFGQQVAVSAGLEHVSGDVAVILDADLQDPPELVPRFIEKWREGFDVVYGIRQKRKENIAKRASYAVFYRLLRALVPFDIPLDSGDFCLLDRRVVDTLNRLPERSRFVRGLRAWVGLPQLGVPYERDRRAAGDTKYPFSKLLTLALDGIFSFSLRPLSLISWAGMLTAIAAFAGLLFFLVHSIIGFKIFGYSPGDVPGFTSVILSVLFIGGMQLFGLGVLGEYIGRIYEEVKARPLYVTKELVGFSEQAVTRGDSTAEALERR